MTQIFMADGTVVPVTVVQAGPCVVVQRKTAEKDGYEAVQLGLVERAAGPRARTSRGRGHFEKAGVAPMRTLMEFRADEGDELEARRQGALRHLQAEQDHVDVIGTSQGQGLQGRHGAPQLPRRRGDARLDVPPGARLDRAVGVPVARLPGHALAGRLGGRQSPPRTSGRPGRRREEPPLHRAAPVPGARNAIVKIVRSSFAKKKA